MRSVVPTFSRVAGLSALVWAGVSVAGCRSPAPQEKQALFNFRPVSSPSPAYRSGVVVREDGEGPDRDSYTVPKRNLLWVTEGIHYNDTAIDYGNAYAGQGYEHVQQGYEHVYPSRYWLEKSNDPVFHDGGELLGFDVQSAEHIVSPDGETLDVRVRVSAPTSASSQRDGNNFAILLDLSESMREPEKIELLRAAGHYLVDQIFPGDRVSLVVVGDETVVPLRTTDRADKVSLHRLIDSLEARGSGGLAAGLDEAYSHMEALVAEDGQAGHVVVVTDGESGRGGAGAWRFISMAVRRQSQNGVRLSVVGVGNQMDSTFLSELARAGDGRFAYVGQRGEIESVLGHELETMLRVYARNVRLKISNPDGAQVLSVHGLEFPTPREGVDELALADFVAGEQRSYLLRLQYPPSADRARIYSTGLRLFFERVAPVRRNAIDRGIAVRAGMKTGEGAANPNVETYSELVRGLETVRLALESSSEASAAIVKQFYDERFAALRQSALASADRDLVHHANLFEYFANRLQAIVATGKLQGASAEREALRKELYYRRYSVRNS